MINLLPPDQKKQIRAGRTNALLVRYSIMSVAVLGLLLAEVMIVHKVLDSVKSTAEATSTRSATETKTMEATKKEAESFKSNLAIAKLILDKEVNYSGLLLKIGNIVPRDTVLSSLGIDQASAGKEAPITGMATSYDKAIELRKALEASPLFSQVKFSSITKAESATGTLSEAQNKYPYTINFTVIFKKDQLK